MNRALVIRIVVAVVVLVFVIGAWTTDGRLNLVWLKFFSTAVTAATVVLGLWDYWLWRLPLAQRLPSVPRSVRGTWRGTLTSFWVNPDTGNRPPPKIVYLVIRQTATLLSVNLLTNESRSASLFADISSIDGTAALTYLYLNRPDMSVEHRSRIHHGSTVLDISGSPARRLRGRYWTDRDSKGELDFDARLNHLVDDFTEAKDAFGD